MYQEIYYPTQISADLDFLKYVIKKNQVKLISNTGLSKLIEKCEEYITSEYLDEEHIKSITVLFTIVNALKNLWFSDVDFTIQLRAMNTGDYSYGNPDPDFQQFFKDFEFEIFSASQLLKNAIQIELPQHTIGEDIEAGDIDIQCKHPNTLNQLKSYVNDFKTRLNQSNRYGVFGLAVEDCFNYSEKLIFNDEDDFKGYMKNKTENNDSELEKIFTDTLAPATRILGIYTTATYFVYINNIGLRLNRMTNSVFCFRPDRKEINDSLYKSAYKLISTFNPHPSWLTL